MLSVEEIKARATSLREALLVSIEKWTDCARLSPEELKELSIAHLKDVYCGLCQWYGNNSKEARCAENGRGNCVLRDEESCCKEWRAANDAWWNYCYSGGDVAEVYAAFWSMVARLESELAKLPVEEKKEEPKRELKHGDYGWAYGKQWVAEYYFSCCSIRIVYRYREKSPTQSGIKYLLAAPDYEYWGNIDDLAALQEDVEEFEVQNKVIGSYLRSKIDGSSHIFIETGTLGKSLTWEEALKFSLKLRAMVATAKRKLYKENKKC